MKHKKIFAIMLIFALLNTFSIQAKYYWQFFGPDYIPSFEEFKDKNKNDYLFIKERGNDEAIMEGAYESLLNCKEENATERKRLSELGVIYGYNRVSFVDGREIKIRGQEKITIPANGASDVVTYFPENVQGDSILFMGYTKTPERKYNIKICLFERCKPENPITLTMAILAAGSDNEKWKKRFDCINFKNQTLDTWESLERADQMITDLLQVDEENYFGICQWHNLLPFREIVFSEIVLPSLDRLNEPSAIKNKTMAQAITDDDYLVVIIPDRIDGAKITSEFVAELFPRHKNKSKHPEFVHYGDQAWQNSALEQVAFNASSQIVPGLHVIKKTPLADSYNKDWQTQVAGKPENHNVPNAVLAELLQLLYFVNNRCYIAQNIAYRTSDIGSHGDHVFVSITENGLDLWDLDDRADPDIGLFVSWKI